MFLAKCRKCIFPGRFMFKNPANENALNFRWIQTNGFVCGLYLGLIIDTSNEIRLFPFAFFWVPEKFVSKNGLKLLFIWSPCSPVRYAGFDVVLIARSQIYRQQVQLAIDAVDHLNVVERKTALFKAIVALRDVFGGIHVLSALVESMGGYVIFPLS